MSLRKILRFKKKQCISFSPEFYRVRTKIQDFWKFRNDENIFNLVPLNGEGFQKYEKFAHFIPQNGKEFCLKYTNLIPINEEEIQNDENIFNLVLLNGEGFWNDEKFSILSCKTKNNFENMKNLPISSHKMEKNFKII